MMTDEILEDQIRTAASNLHFEAPGADVATATSRRRTNRRRGAGAGLAAALLVVGGLAVTQAGDDAENPGVTQTIAPEESASSDLADYSWTTGEVGGDLFPQFDILELDGQYFASSIPMNDTSEVSLITSTDGFSWTKVESLDIDDTLFALAASNGELYVAVTDELSRPDITLHRSSDNGQSWTSANYTAEFDYTGLPFGAEDNMVGTGLPNLEVVDGHVVLSIQTVARYSSLSEVQEATDRVVSVQELATGQDVSQRIELDEFAREVLVAAAPMSEELDNWVEARDLDGVEILSFDELGINGPLAQATNWIATDGGEFVEATEIPEGRLETTGSRFVVLNPDQGWFESINGTDWTLMGNVPDGATPGYASPTGTDTVVLRNRAFGSAVEIFVRASDDGEWTSTKPSEITSARVSDLLPFNDLGIVVVGFPGAEQGVLTSGEFFQSSDGAIWEPLDLGVIGPEAANRIPQWTHLSGDTALVGFPGVDGVESSESWIIARGTLNR